MVDFQENNTIPIYDISPLISSELAVFPGDTLFQSQFILDFKKGDQLSLSNITSTVHLGAHADAPYHYNPEGKTIEHCSLHNYLGKCQVIEVYTKKGERITPNHFSEVNIQAPRILFKTKSYKPNHWTDEFTALSPECIHFLAFKKVILVGIDTPSIDLAKDQKLNSHQAVYETQMSILEGLVLDEVPQGVYQLIALPLKIKGAEAAPVRAILTPFNSNL